VSWGQRRSPHALGYADRAGRAAGADQRRCRDVTFLHGQPFSIGAVTVRDGRIVELDFLADPEWLRLLDLTILVD
jgi:hypothetical protein